MVNDKVPCETDRKKIIGLLPCSGACNVGMITTRAVVELAEKYDNINFVCSLGIPLNIEGIVNNARKSEYYIALNGCKVRCASKALESINISPDQEIVVTKDMNIQKNKYFNDNTGLDALENKVGEIIESML